MIILMIFINISDLILKWYVYAQYQTYIILIKIEFIIDFIKLIWVSFNVRGMIGIKAMKYILWSAKNYSIAINIVFFSV